MLSVPAYATDRDWVDAPLTEAPCQWAPEQGIHLYHFPLSLDSQKVRQGLEELGLAWQSHVILLPAQQQFEPRYARINSRCVVPTLVTEAGSQRIRSTYFPILPTASAGKTTA